MTRLLLIRHAKTDAVGKRLSGRSAGVPLNSEGQVQARELADRLQHLPVDAIYSSPMERAVATANPLANELRLEVQVREDFQELDFGQWTERSFAELAADDVFKRFNTFRSGTRIPGGESMIEAQTRFIGGLEKLCLQHAGQTVAVVSHSDMIKSAIAFYAGIPLDLFQRLEISPASVSIVAIYDDAVSIVAVNHTSNIQF